MERTLKITRGSSPALVLTITEAGGAAPMNITNTPLSIIDSNLPFPLTIVKTLPLEGKATIIFPDTTNMRDGQSYSFKLLVGAPGAPGSIATQEIEAIII